MLSFGILLVTTAAVANDAGNTASSIDAARSDINPILLDGAFEVADDDTCRVAPEWRDR